MQIALGAAQFGLDYGVSNVRGRTSRAETEAILGTARAGGVDLIDTAPAYGDAEDVLASLDARGRGFRIVSKTLGMDLATIRAGIERSLATLGAPLEGLLLHGVGPLMGAEAEAIWALLRGLRESGRVRRIGFSAYPDDPVRDLARRFAPDLVQAPINLVDQRLERDGTLAALADLGIAVHVRSAFHQGLIFVDPDRLPERLRPLRAKVEAIQASIAEDGSGRLRAALSYLARLPHIEAVVVGVTSQGELVEILQSARDAPSDLDFARCATDDPVLIDPRRW